MMTLFALAALIADPAPAAIPRLCAETEQELLAAESTTDEFGYGISVCLATAEGGAQDRVTIILSGEGGNLRTSCLASECEGVIAYSRYTRPRFTQLTLKWMTQAGEHTLIESFDAQDKDAAPARLISHIWAGQKPGQSESEPLVSASEPLALMAIEGSLASE